MNKGEAGTNNNSGSSSDNKETERDFQRKNQWNTILKMTFPEGNLHIKMTPLSRYTKITSPKLKKWLKVA